MTDLWQVGIVHAPRPALLTPDALARTEITWLPDPGSFRFIADPFGLWQGDVLTVFVEAYDYRIKRGEIHYYTYDRGRTLTAQGIALKEPFHLSYPSLIEDGGHIYMLPEANKSGKLTLYRAERFPDQWQSVATLLDIPAVDASIIHYKDRWWMFYALPGDDLRAMRELYIAYANSLTGPWIQHAGNPVRTGFETSRPGGTPFLRDGALYMPMQDCTGAYGVAVNILRIDTLTPNRFEATQVTCLSPSQLLAGYGDGLHTLAGAGDISLIDVKRDDRSPKRHWIKLQHSLRKLIGAL